MSYTLGEAAKATGITKPTLSKAIKNGKMSAIKNENGSYSIDPAELHRVFPAVSGNRDDGGIALRMETPLQLAEILAKEQQERERERLQQEATINDLRRRLDEEATERRQSAEEIRRLTLLLTHQREPEGLPAIVAPMREPREQPPSGWIWFVGGAVLVAGMVGVYVWLAPALLP
jgi:excisionase family DNA binding protein